jgi:hypothetical protein
MIKLVCVSLDFPESWFGEKRLEIDKIYDAVESNTVRAKGYLIKIGLINYWAPANLFITLAELREQQIKSILDE